MDKRHGKHGFYYLVPLTGGTKSGTLGPRMISALSQTGLFIPLLLFFWLSRSNDKPTDPRDLKSNFIPAGRTTALQPVLCFMRMSIGHIDIKTEKAFGPLLHYGTFSWGQHSIQPLVQIIVTVDVRRVGHDRDGFFIGCPISFQSDISLQNHNITFEHSRRG